MKSTIVKNNNTLVTGLVAEGFEGVRTEFIKNFTERGEIGASCCIYYKGKKVVDLWGGYKNKKTQELWQLNTIVKVFSTTKGMSLVVLAKLHSDGLLDYNEKVSTYWPEFSKKGKKNITVEQLITHKSGLVLLDRKVKISELNNYDELSKLLEQAEPMWEPGKKQGYHSSTIGLFIQQLVRRIDKQGRTIGQYFSDKISKSLDIEFYIGLPDHFETKNLATLKMLIPPLALFNLGKPPKGLVKQLINPFSLMMKSFTLIKIDTKEITEELKYEEASGGGAGNARALAKVYGILANGGEELDILPETLKILSQNTKSPDHGHFDQVMKIKPASRQVGWSSGGYRKPDDSFNFGGNSAYGFVGSGGSFAFADPEHKTGYAYVMNKMDFYTQNDPREIALRNAMYKCISKFD